METRQIRFIADAKTWFDKVNGNSYFSVRVTRTDTGETIVCPFQYGYGSHYQHMAREAMAKAGWLPLNDLHLYERENGYPIHWTISDALKREVVRHGVL